MLFDEKAKNLIFEHFKELKLRHAINFNSSTTFNYLKF